jgi:hypothetical protein
MAGRTPAFPGGVESDRALVGVAEWAYGVTDWFEQGLYLSLCNYSQNDGATFNGFKVRELFVKPHAEDSKFFYGVNFEFTLTKTVGSKALYIRGPADHQIALASCRHHRQSDCGHLLHVRP